MPQEEEREELRQRAMAQYAKVGDSGDPWVSGFRNRQLNHGELVVTPVDLGFFFRELTAIPGPQPALLSR